METTDYMILGFGVVFGVIGLHLLSLAARNRNLLAELDVLESRKPAKQPPAKKKPAAKKKRK